MKKLRFSLVTVIAMMLVLQVFAAGRVETLVTFDIASGELAEGVTVDADGNVFVSLSPLGQVLKITTGTDTPELFAQVPGLQDGDFGLLGIAANANGDIYGAVVSSNTETNGVWRFDATTGDGEHVVGTEGIQLANAIAFGDGGEMYVTDTAMGAVWIVKVDGSVEIWLQDPLMTGTGHLGFGIPVGANGIVARDSTVYVGVTELSSIVAIPIMTDGSAGEATVWAQLPAGNHVDGIILDEAGHIIVAAPTSNLVLQVSPDGSVKALATVSDELDAPASVAYYVDAEGNASVYVANFSIAVNPAGGAGPSLMQIALTDDNE